MLKEDWIHTGETESGLQIWAKQEIANGENYLKYEYRTEVGVVTYSDEISFSKVNFLKGLVDIISTENINYRSGKMFKVNELLKENFIKTIDGSKKDSYIQVLKVIDNIEQSLGKDIYNFDMDELEQFRNQNKNVIKVAKEYIDFALEKGYVHPGINKLDLF